MIKINLLREGKGRGEGPRRGKKELLILILCLGLLLLLFGVDQWRMSKAVEETSAEIASAEKEIARYQKLNEELAKAKEAQKILQEKLNVINTLRKEKATPAKVLDELSIDKPDKIQLELVKKAGDKLSIDGIALDDETIANFMTNLRKSKLFRNVDLIVSQQIEVSKIKLKKFSLSCEIKLL
jgi:type IV pilus assembly protein PilN